MAANGAAGTLFAWSVLLPSLGADLGRDPDDLGVVFSTALVAFAVAMLAGGRLVDGGGPRRSALLAGGLSAAGLVVAATGPGLSTLVAGVGVLFGLGSGLTYLSVVTWASTAHAPGRTTEVALVVAAFAAGPIAAAPVAAVVADRLGWRAALGIAAVVVSGVILVAARNLPPRGAGVRIDAGGDGERQEAPAPRTDPVALVALWLMFLGAVLPGLLAFAFAAPAAVERGLPAAAGSLVVAAMAAGNLTGRLLPAAVVPRLGVLPALWGSTLMLGGVVAVLGWTSAPVPAVLAMTLLALQYGAVSALLPAAARLVTTPTRFATAYGAVFSSFGVAGLVGPYAGAVLHEDGDGYALGFRAALVAAGLAAVALAVYQRRLRACVDLPSPGNARH